MKHVETQVLFLGPIESIRRLHSYTLHGNLNVHKRVCVDVKRFTCGTCRTLCAASIHST